MGKIYRDFIDANYVQTLEESYAAVSVSYPPSFDDKIRRELKQMYYIGALATAHLLIKFKNDPEAQRYVLAELQQFKEDQMKDFLEAVKTHGH